MPDFSAIAEISWTDPRVLFLVGMILALILGALVFAALQLERRRLLAASRQEDAERLGRAFAGTGLCFWDWDIRNGVFSYDEEWFATHLGYKSPHESLGLDFIGSVTHPDDIAAKNEALLAHLIGDSETYSAEFRLRRKDGSWIWILSRGKVFERGPDGQAIRFAGADSIIDQQKMAETVLQIEKEVSVRFGETFSSVGIIEAMADGLVQLSEFEFAAAFWRENPGSPMVRVHASSLPSELEPLTTLERNVGSSSIHYYDEKDLQPLVGSALKDFLSVTEVRIVRNGRVGGCVWVGSRSHFFAPDVVIEAIEQLEIQAQGALDRIESESFYRAGQRNLSNLINSIDEMILILDPDYRVVYANDIVESSLGFARQEILGRDLLTLVPDHDRELVRENFADLVSGNLPLCSARFSRKGRGVMLAEVQMTSGRWEESDSFFCVVRDAGKREEATRALEQRDQRLRMASNALVELITARNMEDGIREAIGRVASGYGADRICVSEKMAQDADGEFPAFQQVCCWIGDRSPQVTLGSQDCAPVKIDPSDWIERLRRGEVITATKDEATGDEHQFLESMGVRSLLLVPIHLRDVWWGVMGAETHQESREWSSGDISLLEIVGSGLAGLVETVRLQRDLIAAKEETEKTNRELGEAIRHAQEMAEEASRANRSKTEFLANMSHEIRTPMNAILGFSELIEAEVKEPTLVEFLRAIRSSGKTLLALINDLLDLSKIEAGKMSLQYEPVNLRDLIQDMLNIFQVRCDEKGIALESEIDPDLPSQIVIDEARIRQVIFNLLGNAVKFTHEGKVELRVSSKSSGAGSHKMDLRIEVSDTGIGIEKADQETIFQPFEQSRGQKQKVYGGTGLGLSITSRLVKMMRGSLSLSSAIGRGSSFVIDLREVSCIETAGVFPSSDVDVGAGPRVFSGKEVLVVDDNLLNRRVLSVSLQGMGIRVREAQNGKECLEKIQESKPDLILLDILMPGLSGGETAEIIHANPEWENVPIVACTALDLSRVRQISEKARFNDILVKPVSREVLRSALARFFVTDSSGNQDAVVEESVEPVEGQPRDNAPILSRAEASPDQLRELVATLEDDFLSQWESLRKRFRMKPILTAADRLVDLGREYSVEELIAYGEELKRLIGLFDVSKLKGAMKEFVEVVQSVRKRADGEPLDPVMATRGRE